MFKMSSVRLRFWDTLTAYINAYWQFFSFHKFKIYTSLHFNLHCFRWEIWCHSYFVPKYGTFFSPPLSAFKIFLTVTVFEQILVWCALGWFFLHFLCLRFIETLRSLGLLSSSNLGKYYLLFFSNIFVPPSFGRLYLYLY